MVLYVMSLGERGDEGGGGDRRTHGLVGLGLLQLRLAERLHGHAGSLRV